MRVIKVWHGYDLLVTLLTVMQPTGILEMSYFCIGHFDTSFMQITITLYIIIVSAKTDFLIDN